MGGGSVAGGAAAEAVDNALGGFFSTVCAADSGIVPA